MYEQIINTDPHVLICQTINLNERFNENADIVITYLNKQKLA